ncbi:MAG: AMP-binding protein [Chloroflexota bacterium]
MLNWIKLYHHLPHPLRVLAATARGYYLRTWRYGPEHERLVSESLERETWSAERWKAWQEERLAYVLHRAATQVPYYRESWMKRRREGDRTSWEVLENWPILKKEELRAAPNRFVSDDRNIRRMFRDQTSGTTGTPISVYLTKETLTCWFAIFEARVRVWHQTSINERWAILGGQLVVPFLQSRPPFGVYNYALNQLYLSTYHLSKKSARWYVEALQKYKPTHMIFYPSSAAVLANYAIDQGLKLPGLKVIFSNAEQLLPMHKEAISKAFRCPVRNTYGMGEYVTSASECTEGKMHIWPEVGFIEILNDFDDGPVKNGDSGRIIITGLLNADMPLIRYEVGDRGSLEKDVKCLCGRSLPLLGEIEGRLNDLLITPDGRYIFWVNPVFYGLSIREAQIIQESLDCVHVRYVPAPDYTPAAGRSIVERLQARMGPVEVILEPVAEIPREPNGKFRAVISHLAKRNPQQKNPLSRNS